MDCQPGTRRALSHAKTGLGTQRTRRKYSFVPVAVPLNVYVLVAEVMPLARVVQVWRSGEPSTRKVCPDDACHWNDTIPLWTWTVAGDTVSGGAAETVATNLPVSVIFVS